MNTKAQRAFIFHSLTKQQIKTELYCSASNWSVIPNGRMHRKTLSNIVHSWINGRLWARVISMMYVELIYKRHECFHNHWWEYWIISLDYFKGFSPKLRLNSHIINVIPSELIPRVLCARPDRSRSSSPERWSGGGLSSAAVQQPLAFVSASKHWSARFLHRHLSGAPCWQVWYRRLH